VRSSCRLDRRARRSRWARPRRSHPAIAVFPARTPARPPEGDVRRSGASPTRRNRHPRTTSRAAMAKSGRRCAGGLG
jgi:hypothetical protein